MCIVNVYSNLLLQVVEVGSLVHKNDSRPYASKYSEKNARGPPPGSLRAGLLGFSQGRVVRA